MACTSCGQFSRIEFPYPLVKASTLTRAFYCPLCGAANTKEFGNGRSFRLIAQVMFGRPSNEQEAAQLEQIYEMWDPYTHPTFREFLKALQQ